MESRFQIRGLLGILLNYTIKHLLVRDWKFQFQIVSLRTCVGILTPQLEWL